MAVPLLVIEVAIIVYIVLVLIVISVLIVEVDVEGWLMLHHCHRLLLVHFYWFVPCTKKAINDQGCEYSRQQCSYRHLEFSELILLPSSIVGLRMKIANKGPPFYIKVQVFPTLGSECTFCIFPQGNLAYYAHVHPFRCVWEGGNLQRCK